MYNPNEFSISRSCDYDPAVDRSPVDPFGAIDLRKAFEDGLVDGSVSISSEAFNGVQDPDDLLPRPKDRFEAMRQFDYVKSVLKSASESETKTVTPTGES